MQNGKTEYVPGVCNIGPDEIKKRMMVGWAGLIIAVIAWIALRQYSINPVWNLLIFFPATLSAFGVIQGLSHFCAMFGLRGLLNLDKESGKMDSISQAEYRKKNRARAWFIISESILIGIIVAAIAYYF